MLILISFWFSLINWRCSILLWIFIILYFLTFNLRNKMVLNKKALIRRLLVLFCRWPKIIHIMNFQNEHGALQIQNVFHDIVVDLLELQISIHYLCGQFDVLNIVHQHCPFTRTWVNFSNYGHGTVAIIMSWFYTHGLIKSGTRNTEHKIFRNNPEHPNTLG